MEVEETEQSVQTVPAAPEIVQPQPIPEIAQVPEITPVVNETPMEITEAVKPIKTEPVTQETVQLHPIPEAPQTVPKVETTVQPPIQSPPTVPEVETVVQPSIQSPPPATTPIEPPSKVTITQSNDPAKPQATEQLPTQSLEEAEAELQAFFDSLNAATFGLPTEGNKIQQLKRQAAEAQAEEDAAIAAIEVKKPNI